MLIVQSGEGLGGIRSIYLGRAEAALPGKVWVVVRTHGDRYTPWVIGFRDKCLVDLAAYGSTDSPTITFAGVFEAVYDACSPGQKAWLTRRNAI